jgi:hypothetical protein
MDRTKTSLAGGYGALLAVIAGLSWALHRERSRRCLELPEVPEKLRREAAELASKAAAVAAEVNAFATHAAEEAKALTQKAAKAVH